MRPTMRRIASFSGPAAVAAAVALLGSGPNADSDSSRFVGAGRMLLSSHWSLAFASKYIQAGPLQLALFGSLGRSETALDVTLALATTLLLLAAADAVGVRSSALAVAVGLLGVVIGLTRVGYVWGHPADAMLPLVWILAAVAARRERVVLAGVLVGLSAGLETWGILGVAALALASRWRDVGRGMLVSSAVGACLFAPFVLGGHFEMLQYAWPVRHPSFLSLFLANGAHFGWPLRLLQSMAAVGCGIAAARLLRQSPHAPWVAPLAVVAVRLVLDPLLLPYYRTAVDGPVLVGAALLASRLAAFRGMVSVGEEASTSGRGARSPFHTHQPRPFLATYVLTGGVTYVLSVLNQLSGLKKGTDRGPIRPSGGLRPRAKSGIRGRQPPHRGQAK